MYAFDNYSIRILEPTDANAFYMLLLNNRPRLEDFFAGTVAKTKTLADTRLYVQEIENRKAGKSYFPYLIIDNRNGQIACFIDLKNIDWNIPKAELGCFVDTDYIQKGVSKKALLLLIDYFFKEMGFIKLFLRTHPSNTAARKLAETCGFEMEGTIRKDYKTTRGELVDLIYYGRLA